ncbi:serine/threonine-protein kinase pelle-like, partial [Centruroides sculpturatus]|uniref:serine/threonine-protein kinase pelle-like n=1 Tax=Centruroides sculpturatus TaxID=218467 RepID=UPI000C6D7A94
ARIDNILPLYGVSLDGQEPCLVYQYMDNGSLEDRLRCKNGTAPLTWFQRSFIAIGTAKGLNYLHTADKVPLIHGDIKSANILLDTNFNPKIGDFGLTREGPLENRTHTKVTTVHGTQPYLPLEYLKYHKLSTKVDIYSYGIFWRKNWNLLYALVGINCCESGLFYCISEPTSAIEYINEISFQAYGKFSQIHNRVTGVRFTTE